MNPEKTKVSHVWGSKESQQATADKLGELKKQGVTKVNGIDIDIPLRNLLGGIQAKLRVFIAAFSKHGIGTRCLANILNGDLTFSDVVFYEIEKIKKNPVNQPSHVVQKFYFAAPLEKNFINFIDTQLKYDTSYEYHVNAYMLTFGNKYQYAGIRP